MTKTINLNSQLNHEAHKVNGEMLFLLPFD